MSPEPVEQSAALAEPHRSWGKWIGIAVLGLTTLVLWRTGAFRVLADEEAFAAFIESLGIWGPIAYLAIFTLTAGIAVPGVFYIVPAGIVWPPEVALPLVMVGSMTSSMVGFAFARWMARDWVQKRLPPDSCVTKIVWRSGPLSPSSYFGAFFSSPHLPIGCWGSQTSAWCPSSSPPS